MLDLREIRENPDKVIQNSHERNVEVADLVARLCLLADERARLTHTVDDLQRQRNENAAAMKSAKSQEQRQPLIDQGKDLKERAAQAENDRRTVEEEIDQLLRRIPNWTHPDVPRGADDGVLREVGTKPVFAQPPLDHLALCEKHRLADFEAAAKVTGSNFYYLLGDGVLLEMALVNFAVREAMAAGFVPVTTPDLARGDIVAGTGFIPRGPETQIYSLEGHDLSLIATAEITLAGMHSDEIFEAEDLPRKYVGISHCFRTEAGAAGRATKGLYRVHQFTKVELFAFCRPEDSDRLHGEFLALEEKIFQGLEVPYRVLDIRAGDLGGPAYRKFDLEAWMPGRGQGGEYGEVTSTSNCLDYQARRLKIRFREKGKKGTTFVHMLNGTAVATGRAMIAVMENHQQPDGTIRLPAALRGYMGKETIG